MPCAPRARIQNWRPVGVRQKRAHSVDRHQPVRPEFLFGTIRSACRVEPSAAVVASAIAAASAAAPPVVPSAVVLPAEPAVAASPAAISFIHNSLCSANATVCAKIPCGPARPCSSPFLEPAAAILCRDLAVISRPSQHNLVTGFCLVL